jgi:hypothetical protein
MTTKLLISNATDSPSRSTPLRLPVGDREASRSEAQGGLGAVLSLSKWVRSIPKRQIEVTMLAAGIGTLEGLSRKLIEQ